MIKKFIAIAYLLLFALCAPQVYAQDEIEEIAWVSQNLKIPVSEKFNLNIRPIVRIGDGISRLNNVSFDFSLGYNFQKGFSASLLSRTFFFTERDPRRFIFVDLKKVTKFIQNKLQWNSLIRYHLAFDISGFTDPDFIRLSQDFHWAVKPKLKPMVGVEPFHDLANSLRVDRVRYKLGATWQFRRLSSVNFQYWREQFYNRDFSKINHIFVFTIQHLIKD